MITRKKRVYSDDDCDQDHADDDLNEYRLVRDVVLSGLVRLSIGRSPLSPS